uniref:Uncharacterized protein n=1 Tax=Arundo donax TaxID=35708 RepID=A0A0A9B4P7_ARUDO
MFCQIQFAGCFESFRNNLIWKAKVENKSNLSNGC